MSDELNKWDELVDVRLPRKEYEKLREILMREQAYSVLTNKVRSWWVFAVAGGLIALVTFWEKFSSLVR